MVWRILASDKIVWKLAELRIYFERQKFRSKNAVSGSIRFMQIFAGRGSLERGRQIKVWLLKVAIFASFVYYLPNILHTWPHNSLYVMRGSMILAIFQGH